jgi:VanZ family protein
MLKRNILSIIVSLFIMYLSLSSADTFNAVSFFNFPFFDKIVHFGMYFGLMSVIIFENRKRIKSTPQLFLTGLIPLSYGILMEILQATITSTRSGSVYDALFNSFGILVSILLWLWIKPLIKNRLYSN